MTAFSEAESKGKEFNSKESRQFKNSTGVSHLVERSHYRSKIFAFRPTIIRKDGRRSPTNSKRPSALLKALKNKLVLGTSISKNMI
jgi:hypothetical protein